MQTKTINLYTFDELSDSAKERARQWWRDAESEDPFFAECVIEDAITCGNLLGIEIKTHPVQLMSGKTREDPCIWWSMGGYDSGASFDGYYRHPKGGKGIKSHAPIDETLAGIETQLKNLQKKYRWGLLAGIGSRDHNLIVECDHDSRDITPEDEREVRDAMRQFAGWIYKQLLAEYEYRDSDEQVDENIMCNEYTFTVDGKREDL